MLAGVSALECSPSFFFRPFRIVGTSLPGSNSNSYISFHTFHLHHADVYLVCQEFGITSSPDRVLAVSLFLSILPRRVVSISIFPNTKERNPIHHSSVHVKGRPDDLLLLLRTSPPLNPKIFHLYTLLASIAYSLLEYVTKRTSHIVSYSSGPAEFIKAAILVCRESLPHKSPIRSLIFRRQ